MNSRHAIILTVAAFTFGFAFGFGASESTGDTAVESTATTRGTGLAGLGSASPNASASAGETEALVIDSGALTLRIEEDPGDLGAQLGMAIYWAQRGEIDSSREHFRTSRSLASDSPAALLMVAEALRAVGVYNEALSIAEEAIAIDEENPWPWRTAGRIAFFYLGDYDKAARYYRRHLELAPDAPNADMIQQAIEMIEKGEVK